MSRAPASPLWLLALILLGLAALTALVWFDFLPGGWTLRGLVEPHAKREARLQRARTRERLELFRSENPGVPPGAVVFLGSSAIERFPLETCFSGATCVNRGIGNEPADELLARLDESVPQARPGAFVLYAGSIDFRRLGAAPSEVALRVERILDRLEKLHEGVPVLLIGILPERTVTPAFTEGRHAVNQALRELASRQGAEFLDVDRPPLVDAQGCLEPLLSDDELHLNAAGYQTLARWIADHGGKVSASLAGTLRADPR